jgi:excisionase family DNA binding protein
MRFRKQPPTNLPLDEEVGRPAVKLTVKQAAGRAGVSPALVYRWCDERRLPHYRCGGRGRRGRILIDPVDLDAFLETLKITPRPPGDDGEFRHSRRPSASPS